MFSFEYCDKEMIISTYNEKRINFLNIERLKKIVITGLSKSCQRVIINLIGVQFIDPGSVGVLKFLATKAVNAGKRIYFLNANSEICRQFKENHFNAHFESIFPDEQLAI